MTSKPVAQLLVDLGVGRSHSRPRVSNDNPYSEAQTKTTKYCPEFPERFGSLADARAFCHQFFDRYNHEHRHRALGLHTPASVHFGTATEIRAQRAAVLDAAYAANPHRFRKPPVPPKLPTAAWINRPTPGALTTSCAVAAGTARPASGRDGLRRHRRSGRQRQRLARPPALLGPGRALLGRGQAGHGPDRLVQHLASPQVPGKRPPVLRVGDAVLDGHAGREVGEAGLVVLGHQPLRDLPARPGPRRHGRAHGEVRLALQALVALVGPISTSPVPDRPRPWRSSTSPDCLTGVRSWVEPGRTSPTKSNCPRASVNTIALAACWRCLAETKRLRPGRCAAGRRTRTSVASRIARCGTAPR